jgi:hypothetical protein
MKKLLFTSALITLTCCLFAQKPSLKHFQFLVGKWELKTNKGKIIERWQQHTDSLTATSHRFDAAGDSVLTETIVLKHAKGHWYFSVTGYEKNNLGTTDFKLIDNQQNTFVFENKQHDFPQRIVYENKGNDMLLAWIEGNINGKTHKIEFPYRRAN